MTPAERAAVLRRASAQAASCADWWTSHEQLAELWRWLEDQGREPIDAGYFLEKPWHWQLEYDEMRKAQEVPL